MSTFKDVPSRVDVDQLEWGILDYWEEDRVFEQSLAQNEDKELFSFYDGPPYATGKPHYGHILQSAIKDTVLRYKTMRGYFVPRRVGWDTHGLPVETIVEKELGFKSKKDIEAYGIEKFNQKCREAVTRYVDEFTATLKRMGRWADYENAYSTFDRDYMESEWWLFRQLWDRELVYKAWRSTPYCTRCETPLSNFEVSINYKDTDDQAVYVLLKSQDVWLLVWTTTPWTLPGNAAVAVSPDLEYVSVEHEGKEIVMAKDRVGAVFGEEVKVTKAWKTEALLGLKYESLYDVFGDAKGERFFTVVASDHVTAEDGTGLVHIAPSFGQEDFEVGEREDIKPPQIVDRSGKYLLPAAKGGGPELNKRNIFEAQGDIVADLDERGLLFRDEQQRHSYPFCWRCETPLIYYALDTWFVKIGVIKERMLSVAEQISWTPTHVKKGRFGKGLESAPDWAVSRNRFWSVPLPIWECSDCEERVCVGSLDELGQLSGEAELDDIHRPYVDDLSWACAKCDEGSMKRVPEVLDVWFDAGSMPYAQWHYPFENSDLVEERFPADFIVEAVEQTRLWFYVLHVLAVALTDGKHGLGKDKPAYLNAIGSGLIFAEDGKKLSKKLKNYPEIEPTMKQYGADVMRLYLLSSATLGEPYRFAEKDLKQLRNTTYMTLWNVYSFFVRYANTAGWQPPKNLESKTQDPNILDQWVLARVQQFEREVFEATEAFQVDRAARLFAPFIDDLSNWYVRRSRERFHPTSDTEAAFVTLYEVLVRMSKVMASYMPFLAEEMHRNLVGYESVHLEKLDEPDELTGGEEKLLERMRRVRGVVSAGLALRAKEGIRVRQPLAELTYSGEEKLDEVYQEMIADEVNVKSISYKMKLSEEAELDTNVTAELKREGLAREIIRHGQVLRKEAGYALDDRITFLLATDDKELKAAFEEHRNTVLTALQVDEVVSGGETDKSAEVKVNGTVVQIGVRLAGPP